MRIGLLTSVGRTIDAFFQDAVATWSESGHVVFCAAGTEPTADVRFDLIDGLTQRPAMKNLGVPLRLRTWAQEHELDVIVTNTATASTLARLAPLPCPLVYFCHGLHWNRDLHPARIVESALVRRADSVVTINSDDHAWFSARHDNVLYLREGVGVPRTYPWAQIPPNDELHLCWAGDFVPRKRPELAIRVMAELVRLRPGSRLTMLGDGELASATLRLARELGVEASITFTGRADVRPHIEAAHAMLHTATWEGLPRILLEGAAMGRQSFGFDVKGVRDVPHVRVTLDGDVAGLARLVADNVPRRALDPSVGDAMRSDAVARRLLQHVEAVVG
jgi:glycosyltransferase involved in cell wall biosynthesis